MDLALGSLDFIEVFQFGVLHAERWYELLNAGMRFTGIAGSDFPANLGRLSKSESRWISLLGPERAMVKASGGASAYEAWAAGVKRGEVVVTNGPLVELKTEGGQALARARFYRPIEALQIIADGKVVAVKAGGTDVSLKADFGKPHWIAARAIARKETGEPDIQGHTNPIYLREGHLPEARAALAQRWSAELDYYRGAPLQFPTNAARDEFFKRAERALEILRR